MVQTMGSSLLLLCVLTTPIVATGPMRRAIPIAQAIEPRVAYGGGWPLGLDATGGACPAVASVACERGLSDSMNQMCCPSGQTCLTDGYFVAWCCPTSADCKNYINNFSSCANTTWIMYQASLGAVFCCEPGKIAVNSGAGGVYNGLCVDSDQPVAQSVLAKSLNQATATATSVDPSTTPSSQPSSTPSSQGVSLTQTSSGTSPDATDPSSPANNNPDTTPTNGGSASGSSNSGNPTGGSSSNNKSSALGTGPIVGIVIGVIGLMLLAGIFWALLRRRRTVPRPDNSNNNNSTSQYQYAPAPAHPSASELGHSAPGIQRKPSPHIMATSMYSSSTPQRAPSAVSQQAPPGYDSSQRYDPSSSPGPNSALSPQRYDSPPPAAPGAGQSHNHPYDSYAEMEGRHGVPPVELRADRTGN